MENCYKANGSSRHRVSRQNKQPFSIRDKSLPCFDIRVFLVRVCKSDLHNSAPEVLKLKCVSSNPGTLLEVNGVRPTTQSEGVSSLLKRDRVDKKSKEVTFVSTDSTKMSSNVKFDVFDDKDVLLVSGVLELCNSNNGSVNGKTWSMDCDSIIIPGTSFFKGKKLVLPGSALPTIEVYIAGSFLDTPIVLTKTLHLSSQKKHIFSATNMESQMSAPSTFTLQAADNNMSEKAEEEDSNSELYQRRASYAVAAAAEEDGEMSWFNAGVRVGVGIGLSVCIGIGIGVGVLVKTYQGTTRNFRRRLL